MKYSLLIDKAAEQDIADTISWYNEQQHGLGNEYLEELKSALERLRENPLLFRIRYRNTRMVLLKRFPFFAHFYVDQEKKVVTILSVLYAGREPQLWLDRTMKREQENEKISGKRKIEPEQDQNLEI
ncbi:MAG: hypothetical protein GC181_12770 [Bacteroidetes bacterium]|nr:hypothetical protein [Bacteroidota bacterium]